MNCPTCKNPLMNSTFDCEWCGAKLTSDIPESFVITAFCMRTGKKNVPMVDAVITKTSGGKYMANGHDGQGNKMTTYLEERLALDAVNSGVAKKAW